MPSQDVNQDTVIEWPYPRSLGWNSRMQLEADGISFDQLTVERQAVRRVLEARLLRRSDQCRAVMVRLLELDGRPTGKPKAVAEELGIKVGSVYSYRNNAHDALIRGFLSYRGCHHSRPHKSGSFCLSCWYECYVWGVEFPGL